MKTNWLAIILTLVNLGLLILLLTQNRALISNASAQILTAQVIELVDDRGQVRAQLKVETSGEVVFRLRDEKGTIRVKLSASEQGSGLVLLNDLTEPGVHILATEKRTGLTVTGRDGAQRAIEP